MDRQGDLNHDRVHPGDFCSAPGCDRPGWRSFAVEGCARISLCATHAKRLQRGAPLTPPIAQPLDPLARLVEAAIALADADSAAAVDDRFRILKRALQDAALRFAKSRGWRAPMKQERLEHQRRDRA